LIHDAGGESCAPETSATSSDRMHLPMSTSAGHVQMDKEPSNWNSKERPRFNQEEYTRAKGNRDIDPRLYLPALKNIISFASFYELWWSEDRMHGRPSLDFLTHNGAKLTHGCATHVRGHINHLQRLAEYVTWISGRDGHLSCYNKLCREHDPPLNLHIGQGNPQLVCHAFDELSRRNLLRNVKKKSLSAKTSVGTVMRTLLKKAGEPCVFDPEYSKYQDSVAAVKQVARFGTEDADEDEDVISEDD
jgi:hypothetical protein